MSNPYISNSNIYQTNAERDISVILSRFNTQFIYDCIENALSSRTAVQINTINPNLVRSLEDTFLNMQKDYPDDIANILECRESTYIEIIEYLCSRFNLSFNNNDNIDLYSAAYYLYDLLVANYLNYEAKFFSKYIIMEKNNLYKSLNLDKLKKSININYAKKICNDPIMPTILIQIPYIINQLLTFDFNFSYIVSIIYDDTKISNFVSSSFFDNNYFYNYYRYDINNPVINSNIITNIRLSTQSNSMSNNILNNFTKK